jgi:hypothetical protein
MNIRICNFVCREKKSRIRRKQNQSKKKIQKMIDDEFTLLIQLPLELLKLQHHQRHERASQKKKAMRG